MSARVPLPRARANVPGATYSRSGYTSNGNDLASATIVPRPFCRARASGSSNLKPVRDAWTAIMIMRENEPWQAY